MCNENQYSTRIVQLPGNGSIDHGSTHTCDIRSHRTVVITTRSVVLSVVRRATTGTAVGLNNKGVAVNDLYRRSIGGTK